MQKISKLKFEIHMFNKLIIDLQSGQVTLSSADEERVSTSVRSGAHITADQLGQHELKGVDESMNGE